MRYKDHIVKDLIKDVKLLKIEYHNNPKIETLSNKLFLTLSFIFCSSYIKSQQVMCAS